VKLPRSKKREMAKSAPVRWSFMVAERWRWLW